CGANSRDWQKCSDDHDDEAWRHHNRKKMFLECFLRGSILRILLLILRGIRVNQRRDVVVLPSWLWREGGDAVVNHRRKNNSDANCECEFFCEHMWMSG